MFSNFFPIFLLIFTGKVHGFPDLFTLNSTKKFAEEFTEKIDFQHQLTTNLSQRIETGMIDWKQVEFLWDVQMLLEETKQRYVGLSRHVSMWDNFHDFLVKHVHGTNQSEGVLNDLHSKTYIFYATMVYFLQQVPALGAEDRQSLELEPFCEGFRVMKDSNLLFGQQEAYVNNTKDLGEYFEELYKVWKTPQRLKFCGKTPSLRAGLFRYFKVILAIHLRRFTISYFGTAVCSRATAKRETDIFNQFINESTTLTALMHSTLKNLDHSMFDCPPKAEERDQETLKIQLEGLVRTKIIHEPALSSASRPCKHNCDLWSIGSQLKTAACAKPLDCRYISSKFDACVSGNSSRWYEWIRDNEGNIYGSSQRSRAQNVCQGRTETLSSQYTWYNGLYCDYCVCTCVGNPKNSRNVVTAISFRDQLSDIDNNWVVVGVRFVNKDFMIHVQIKEGQLLPFGAINATRWRELEWFDYSEENDLFYLINPYANISDKVLRPGLDYGLAEKINLDDVRAPWGKIITGVRFRFAWDMMRLPRFRRGTIQLQIRATKFDFIQGKLKAKSSYWIPASLKSREEMALEDPDDPTKAPEELQDVTSGLTVKFRASDFHKDAGQSTVPFFDGRDLEFSPSAPLQGLGLFHRGHRGFGGYLAFRAFDFDMSSIFSDS